MDPADQTAETGGVECWDISLTHQSHFYGMQRGLEICREEKQTLPVASDTARVLFYVLCSLI